MPTASNYHGVAVGHLPRRAATVTLLLYCLQHSYYPTTLITPPRLTVQIVYAARVGKDIEKIKARRYELKTVLRYLSLGFKYAPLLFALVKQHLSDKIRLLLLYSHSHVCTPLLRAMITGFRPREGKTGKVMRPELLPGYSCASGRRGIVASAYDETYENFRCSTQKDLHKKMK